MSHRWAANCHARENGMNPGGRFMVLIPGNGPRIAVRDESEQCTIVLYGSPTIGGWTRSAKRRIGFGGKESADPSIRDRSWPTDASIIRSSPDLMSWIDMLSKSERISPLGLFDETKKENLSTELRGGNDHVASALLFDHN